MVVVGDDLIAVLKFLFEVAGGGFVGIENVLHLFNTLTFHEIIAMVIINGSIF